MKFPLIKKSKVKFHSMLMALSIESDYGGEIYGRKYYLVRYEDDSELIFLTTNEPDSDFNERILDEEFMLISDLEQLVNDFENTELIGIAINAGFNSPPKYIYYDIIVVDAGIKPFILAHLKESMSGYTDIDYNDNEKKQLKIWLNYLND